MLLLSGLQEFEKKYEKCEQYPSNTIPRHEFQRNKQFPTTRIVT